MLAASLGRALAQRMVLLEEELDAETLVAVGLTDRVHAVSSFLDEVTAAARRRAAGPAVALAYGLSAVNQAALAEMKASFAREVAGQVDLMDRSDFDEGVRAVLEGRTPQWSDEPPKTPIPT
ncbi:enoyl-CoA hydratase-related protein [Rhodococcus sp. ZPP]|uniref:enoyl-CoA hydratase-related protein n=1 Tax=Rhodococcus sp. ZPP TaxID=2749906 RepID=UPI001AD87BF1|nr:enoyl-CoA hydratase-related protein [Rhodococcus sp. ZPP]